MRGRRRSSSSGGLNDPFSGNKQNLDSLITSLDRVGLNVYPVSSFSDRLRFIQEVSPASSSLPSRTYLMMGGGSRRRIPA